MQIVVLGVVRPEMAIDSVPKKWNRCLMRGLSMDNPHTVWGLLKQSELMVGLKLSMCVVFIILLKNEWLEICAEKDR